MNPKDAAACQVLWILRVGVAMEFLGHGMLGMLHLAPTWVAYFGVVGISRETANTLMPIVGACDVTMALAVLLFPIRGVVLWMALWGLWTAILRPLAREPIWEAVERAGNYGAPFALFLLAGGGGAGSWLRLRLPEGASILSRPVFQWTLRLSTALLLLGHGVLNLWVRKSVFESQYAMLGLREPWVEPAVGVFESLLALGVLACPGFGLLLFVVAWKLATEALFPVNGSPIWVFIEHGGSYAAPLALALLALKREKAPNRSFVPRRPEPQAEKAVGS